MARPSIRRRQILARPRPRARLGQRAESGLFGRSTRVGDADSLTVRSDAEAPVGDFLFHLAWGDAVIVAPESRRRTSRQPGRHRPFRFERWAKGDRIEHRQERRYWGTPVALDHGDLPVHRRRRPRDRRAAGRRRRRVPDHCRARDALRTVQGRSALQGRGRHDRGRDDPRHEQPRSPSTTSGCARPSPTPSTARRSSTAPCSATARRSAAISRPTNPDYVDLTGTYPYDPAKAKALLAEAGYPDGFTATLQAAAAGLRPPRRRDHRRPARARSASSSRSITVEWAAVARARSSPTRTTTSPSSPYRAARHRHLRPRRLLLRLQRSRASRR